MDDLKHFALFAEVVRAGSLSAAARHLGISTSAVSQQLRALEQRHGVTLLHRSTRKLGLTEAGRNLAEHCAALAATATRARQQLALARDAPEGELRMSAPVGFARCVAPALAPLLADHAALRLHLEIDDRMIDLVDARIDLAIRVGEMADSGWSARRLCGVALLLCAAPAYLARAGVPQSPRELLLHQWLAPRGRRAMPVEMTGPGGATEAIEVTPRITSNSQISLQQLCVSGLGLAFVVGTEADEDLQARRLVRVLPDWRVPPMPLWAVTPQRDAKPAKVRHAIAALETYLRGFPGTSD
ncbi:LysR family transcriptional regulator [Pseudorhodoferax sp.]|uniref:LysR family transcriptional regulator n=1 Tax=Pseudorhodoferax sp. TaxID=1993553 RepID=UPI002DD61ADB|nr:LysR family transcriptional regulator [Pseudorhodoferax sp.]